VLVEIWRKEGKMDDKKQGQTDHYSGHSDVDQHGPYTGVFFSARMLGLSDIFITTPPPAAAVRHFIPLLIG
jgi:hypothetical protein